MSKRTDTLGEENRNPFMRVNDRYERFESVMLIVLKVVLFAIFLWAVVGLDPELPSGERAVYATRFLIPMFGAAGVIWLIAVLPRFVTKVVNNRRDSLKRATEPADIVLSTPLTNEEIEAKGWEITSDEDSEFITCVPRRDRDVTPPSSSE